MKTLRKRGRSRILLAMLLILGMPSIGSLSAMPATDSGGWISLENGEERGRYFRENNVIHVHVNGMIREALKHADSESFKVHEELGEFGRDRSHIWFISSQLDVDAATWQLISREYSKDKEKVYSGIRALPGADPDSFKVIRPGLAEWGADENSVYHQWFRLENSDPQTFQFIDDTFSRDKANVYYNQNRLDGADPDSFQVIAVNVGKDKDAIFAFGNKMPAYIDMASVRVPGDGYIYDRNGRYYMQKGEWVKDDY